MEPEEQLFNFGLVAVLPREVVTTMLPDLRYFYGWRGYMLRSLDLTMTMQPLFFLWSNEGTFFDYEEGLGEAEHLRNLTIGLTLQACV